MPQNEKGRDIFLGKEPEMAKYRKLGRTSDQRKALLRNQVTALINNGKIVTTEAKAKEVRKIAEGLIALACKEADNFEMVKVEAKVARKDKDGKRSSFVEEVDFKSLKDFYTTFKSLYDDHLSFGEIAEADKMMTKDLKELLDILIKL